MNIFYALCDESLKLHQLKSFLAIISDRVEKIEEETINFLKDSLMLIDFDSMLLKDFKILESNGNQVFLIIEKKETFPKEILNLSLPIFFVRNSCFYSHGILAKILYLESLKIKWDFLDILGHSTVTTCLDSSFEAEKFLQGWNFSPVVYDSFKKFLDFQNDFTYTEKNSNKNMTLFNDGKFLVCQMKIEMLNENDQKISLDNILALISQWHFDYIILKRGNKNVSIEAFVNPRKQDVSIANLIVL